ncbi:hypothetical protein PAT3040_06700 [Paenibacillus agaridevorans]|uniref:Sporulation protein YjcZ n=2 Tax=Paenibacillus agaridevorans TaxID=171404 RepID=A0A2R5EYV4_9BACL|nr:hypothetical protein PAT3040_06700 [Paenibacillus agaridevorans]
MCKRTILSNAYTIGGNIHRILYLNIKGAENFMNYAANVSGGANHHYPVAGAGCGNVGGAFNNVGAILVLFILLVIIAKTLCCF